MLLHKGILPKKTYVYLDLSQLVSKWHGWFLIWSNPSFFLTDLRTTLFNLRVKKYFLSNFISNIFNTRKLPVGSVPPDCWPYPEVSHVSEGMGASTSWMGTHPSPREQTHTCENITFPQFLLFPAFPQQHRQKCRLTSGIRTYFKIKGVFFK